MVLLCKSFEKEKCSKRLDFYVEKNSDGERVIVRSTPCPFYGHKNENEDKNEKKGLCSIEGEIGLYSYGFGQSAFYEQKCNQLKKIERPELILKL